MPLLHPTPYYSPNRIAQIRSHKSKEDVKPFRVGRQCPRCALCDNAWNVSAIINPVALVLPLYDIDVVGGDLM